MPEFHLEKIDECKKVLKEYFSKVTISDDVLNEVGERFARAFKAALTDDSSTTDRFGQAAWKMTEQALKAQVRKLAALSEYYAREERAQAISLDHVKKAMEEVRKDCPVTTSPLRDRRLEYCGWGY